MDGIRTTIGADSLGYVSLDQLIKATEQPTNRLCTACFSGEYPIELPSSDLIGKHVLEGVQRRVDADPADGLASLEAAGGAEDALQRP